MVRLGIVGCGNMCAQHSDSFAALKGIMEVTAVCDIDPDRAQKAKTVFGAKTSALDYRCILEDVDAVLISLPHELHYEVGKFFVENGRHVLMEKPLCRKETECLALTKLAERRRVVLMTAYPVRFWGSTQKMKEYMDRGVIGEVFQISICTDHYNPPRDTRGSWMTCSGLGGGQTFSHGCHYIDVLLWMLGAPVSGTHVGTNRGTPWMDREGTSHTVIKFQNGALGCHTGTWGARGTSGHYKVEIYGTTGTLSYCTKGENKRKIILFRDKTEEVLWRENTCGKNTCGELAHFADCIVNKQTPVTNGYVSTTGLRVIWKLYEAEMKNEIADLRGLGLTEPFIEAAVCTFDCDSAEATRNYDRNAGTNR